MTLVKMLEDKNWEDTCQMFVFTIDKYDHPPSNSNYKTRVVFKCYTVFIFL